MFKFTATCLLGVILSCVIGLQAARADERPRRPNIVVIVTDDMGYGDVGFNGCKDIPTPHIDALAKTGMVCTDGYASAPVCSPSRAGLLTGRYQNRFGFEFNGGGRGGRPTALPASEKTIADYLKEAGYATGMVGKWHLGFAPEAHPLDRGFDELFGFIGGGHSYLPIVDKDAILDTPDSKNPVVRNREPVEEKEYLTDAFARETVAFVDRHKHQPFFLYLAFNAPHVPLQASEEYLQRVSNIENPGRRKYAAMMCAVDDAIGDLTAKLKEEGLEEDTLVFFFSDNGGHLFGGSSNAPLRAGKSTTYEGGIRVPFVVKWPGKIPAGGYSQPVITLDVLPTALAAAGITPPADAPFDGVNLLPFLAAHDDRSPHETLFWRFGDFEAVRQGQWKLTMTPTTEPALYDLAEDISESKDVSAEHPEIKEELLAKHKLWRSELPPPLWPPGIFEPNVLRKQSE